MEFIELKKVATNNLKNIDVRLPIGKFSVVTGVSGSGKSSLVFDTLYSEAYRRYVESLSSFARQYLKALPKPQIQEVKNLPPAIAVKQTRSMANSRSTVGTMTEIYDLLRIIFAHSSEIVCPACQKKVVTDSGESIAKGLVTTSSDEQVYVLAPLRHWQKVGKKELQKQLMAQGFSRLLVDHKVVRLEDVKLAQINSAFVVIDRLVVSKQNFRRIADSFELALNVGRGFAAALMEGASAEFGFSSDLSCQGCGRKFVEPTLALFSFNHPYGACPNCQGFGYEGVLDWDKVIPRKHESLANESIALWNFGSRDAMYGTAKRSAKARGIDIRKPFSEYTEKEWQWLKEGDEKYKFCGVHGFYKWIEENRHKAHYRIHAARFKKYVPCAACGLGRINDAARACRIDGMNIVEVSNLSIERLSQWMVQLQKALPQLETAATKNVETVGIHEAVSEALVRIDYLLRIGLSYLTLNRTTRTLSGGEQQRIHMSRCLGSALTDTLYCLDEPTSGLHARDGRNLLSVIHGLRDQGNTVVVVEHDRNIMAAADHLLEIGPGAGHQGGEIVYDGAPNITGKRIANSLGGNAAIRHAERFFLRGAHTHNLQHVDAEFPAGMLTVVCGVSGSGKTSLIQHTLYPMLAKYYGEISDELVAEPKAHSVGPESVLKKFANVVFVSQSPIGRSSRSNIATYLGVFEEIRKVLAATDQAKAHKFTPGTFSFNTPGGRCETCKGLGTVIEDLSFLGEMAVVCPTCNGKRFEEKVLQITYRGKSLSDILKMTIVEAHELFFDRPNLRLVLESIMEMGMGYVTIGQNTHSFSGGEAQRLKLIKLIKETKKDGRPLILVFDEPTTGLSDKDVHSLIAQFKKLTVAGHSIIIVEHHLDVIAQADWLIEIGPEAAEKGGRVIFQGPVELLKSHKNSIIAPFLWEKSTSGSRSTAAYAEGNA